MSRGPYPGWSLTEDGYLDEPVPDSPPRRGCLYWILACVVVLVAVAA